MSKELDNTNKKQFSEILSKIKQAKQQAFQQINTTLVQLYWNVGSYVSKQVKESNWGKNTVKELAKFIQTEEAGIRGFSSSNIWRMKQFYGTYEKNAKLATLWRVLPWSHNRRIMTLKSPEEGMFYALLENVEGA